MKFNLIIQKSNKFITPFYNINYYNYIVKYNKFIKLFNYFLFLELKHNFNKYFIIKYIFISIYKLKIIFKFSFYLLKKNIFILFKLICIYYLFIINYCKLHILKIYINLNILFIFNIFLNNVLFLNNFILFIQKIININYLNIFKLLQQNLLYLINWSFIKNIIIIFKGKLNKTGKTVTYKIQEKNLKYRLNSYFLISTKKNIYTKHGVITVNYIIII